MPLFRIAVAVLLGGCLVDVDYGNSSFRCQGADCPDGFVCRQERCVPPDATVFPGPFRRRLGIDYRGAEVLTSFPVLVTLDATRIDYAAAGPVGESLRFTDLDNNLLAHEIERWDETGTSRVWLAIPSLVPDEPSDDVYMYWGSSEAPAALPEAAVWNDDYVAVWHLDDDPGGGAVDAVLDATGKGHHGTASASMGAEALEEGPLGIGTYFDDVDDAVVIGDDPAFALPRYSYSFWLRGDFGATNDRGNGQPIYNADQQFNFSWNHGQAAFAQAATHNDDTGPVPSQISETVEADVWYAIAATYDGTDLRVFLDGVEMQAVPVGTPVTRMGPMALGNDPAAVRFAGALDEVRVSTIARSPAWIAAVYATAATDMISFGAEEAL